jgi:hypothetical protein
VSPEPSSTIELVGSPEAAIEPAKPRRPFHPRKARVAMPVDAATRQGRAAMFAWEVLSDGEAVRLFLNTHDADLGGRPIDIATASTAGLAQVEAAVTRKGAARHDQA